MRKDNSKIGRCLEFFALQKIGMTPTLLSYSGLSRVSRGFKWILGTSPRMTKERVCAKFLTCIGMTILFCLLPSTAYAECTPAPDCASIGYTETSCETTSLKCPFDTTKLYCLPCDSSFKYDCNASNQIGVGNTCNGKYASCSCANGYILSGNNCITKPNCTLGMIYYSDYTCSTELDSNKRVAGVVIKDNELIMTTEEIQMTWGTDDNDIDSLPNLGFSDANQDYDGKNNTSIIVAHYGKNADNVAAVYCYNYAPTGMENTKTQWYLPAIAELQDYVSDNYSILKTVYKDNFGWASSRQLLSSTENIHMVYTEYFDGDTLSDSKTTSHYVICFLSI